MPKGEPFGSSSEPPPRMKKAMRVGVKTKHAFRPKFAGKKPPKRTPEQHEEAISLMERRAAEGLDLWTGEPIY